MPVEQTDSVDSHEVKARPVRNTCYQELAEASGQKVLAVEKMVVVSSVGFLGHRYVHKARTHYQCYRCEEEELLRTQGIVSEEVERYPVDKAVGWLQWPNPLRSDSHICRYLLWTACRYLL